MRNQKSKHHNAYKHGAFSRYAIVPGEDEKEFEALYSALVQEWMPVGVQPRRMPSSASPKLYGASIERSGSLRFN
jgi:hypothetical protein